MCFMISDSSYFYYKYLKNISVFPPKTITLDQPNLSLQASMVLVPGLIWDEVNKDRDSKTETSVGMQSKDRWVSTLCVSLFSLQNTR